MDNNNNLGFEPSKPFTEQPVADVKEENTNNQVEVDVQQTPQAENIPNINQNIPNGFEPVSPFNQQYNNFNQVNNSSEQRINSQQSNPEFNEQSLYSGFDNPQPPTQRVNYSAQNMNNNYAQQGFVQPTQNVNTPYVQRPMNNNPVYQNYQPQKPFNNFYQTPQQNVSNFQQTQIPSAPVNYSQANQNQGYMPQQNGFQPVYGNNFQQTYQQSQPMQQQMYYGNNYGVQQMQKPKQKTNAGAIVLIVVLSVLFVGSVIGMVVFGLTNNDNKTDNQNDKPSISSTVPKEDKSEDGTSDESSQQNYSEKVNPDYDGLTLNKKPDKTDNTNYNAEYANKQVVNSTVAIVCYKDEITTAKDAASQGTGIIITSDGYVVTNSHVIGDSKDTYKIQIVTSDNKEYKAGVVGFDTRTDIALLKIDGAEKLSPANFGNSEEISLGEEVIVVGNPGGIEYSNSVTKGIISAVDRQINPTSSVKFIQTDAAINPGNSGGPVVNMYGQVIGIATAKIASEEIEGMGFAIPSKTIKEVVDDLMKYSYVQGRVKIGITGSNVTSEYTMFYDIPQGIMVSSITSGGPCDGSGLQVEDIIIGFNDEEVKTFSDIYALLEKCSEGDKVTLKYYRPSNKETYTTEIVLQKSEE